jgi:toxin ParE1/3/4
LVPGTRELTVLWPYVIVYRIASGVVEILEIWHGAQERRQ